MFSGGNGPAAIKSASHGAEVAQKVRKQEIDRLFLELKGMWSPTPAGQPEAKTCYYCDKDSVALKGKLMFTVESSMYRRLIDMPEFKLILAYPSILNDESNSDQDNEDFLARVGAEAFSAVWLSLSNHRIHLGPDSLRQNDSDESELSRLLFGLDYGRAGTNDLGFYLGVVMMKDFSAQD